MVSRADSVRAKTKRRVSHLFQTLCTPKHRGARTKRDPARAQRSEHGRSHHAAPRRGAPLLYIRAGYHSVSAEKDGRKVEESLTVERGKETEIELMRFGNFGSVFFPSRPKPSSMSVRRVQVSMTLKLREERFLLPQIALPNTAQGKSTFDGRSALTRPELSPPTPGTLQPGCYGFFLCSADRLPAPGGVRSHNSGSVNSLQ